MPEPNQNQGNTPPADGGTPPAQGGQGQAPQTWDAFVESLPAEARALYDGHITGLTNTVKATRDERDSLKARIKAITDTLGDDPVAVRTKLEALQAEVEKNGRRATFVEEAIKPEVGCRNPSVAYMVAEAGGLWTRKGEPDWPAIKAAAPELFGPVSAPGHAGTGTGSPPPTAFSMDDFIRRQAGVGPR